MTLVEWPSNRRRIVVVTTAIWHCVIVPILLLVRNDVRQWRVEGHLLQQVRCGRRYESAAVCRDDDESWTSWRLPVSPATCPPPRQRGARSAEEGRWPPCTHRRSSPPVADVINSTTPIATTQTTTVPCSFQRQHLVSGVDVRRDGEGTGFLTYNVERTLILMSHRVHFHKSINQKNF